MKEFYFFFCTKERHINPVNYEPMTALILTTKFVRLNRCIGKEVHSTEETGKGYLTHSIEPKVACSAVDNERSKTKSIQQEELEKAI